MPKKKNSWQDSSGFSDAKSFKTSAPASKAVIDNALKSKPAKAGQPVTIDYPQERELVTSHSYTIRISASGYSEISFNGGKDWRSCREAGGNWWFDWSGYSSGAHKIVARTKTGDNSWLKSKARQFTVVI